MNAWTKRLIKHLPVLLQFSIFRDQRVSPLARENTISIVVNPLSSSGFSMPSPHEGIRNLFPLHRGSREVSTTTAPLRVLTSTKSNGNIVFMEPGKCRPSLIVPANPGFGGHLPTTAGALSIYFFLLSLP